MKYSEYQPLSDRIRPQKLADFVGQTDVVGDGKLLRRLIEKKGVSSLIFWGPPGVGKTTLANLIANELEANFVALSAVESGKKDLQLVIEQAKKDLRHGPPAIASSFHPTSPESELDGGRADEWRAGKRTLLFVDEIHRWNKAQQDALLPYVEKGIVTLIGATTENPSFEIIGALLSRSQVIVLKKLTNKDIVQIVERAITDKEFGLGELSIKIDQQAIELLAELSGGDARVALNALEIACKSKIINHKSEIKLTKSDIKEALQKTHLVFDKKGEEFYNIISALHKSMRGSDPNAALYWLARMLEGGADPLYIARRVVRFASEDIGMANSEALVQATAAFQACHWIGMPECTVHLAQAVVYCAKSKKSNLLYAAYGKAAEDARRTSHLGVPLHIRNAPTKLMKELDYGKGYRYNPDYKEPVDQEYLPEELRGRDYFN
ncbi:MAG: replication-associated recombination protein A [Candidatus Magasanikbacteria bacterium]|nr:replication-associated recombination protein A [Candidatus Magasanikbacteria bacterium]